MFEEAAIDFDRELVKVSPGGLTYFAEAKYGRLEHKMDHLACFAGRNGSLPTYIYNDFMHAKHFKPQDLQSLQIMRPKN